MNPEAVAIAMNVMEEHRTMRAWSFGYGEDMNAPKNSSGCDCRCGKRWIRMDRSSDPQREWSEHWATEVLTGLEAAGFSLLPPAPVPSPQEDQCCSKF